tara:strand:- start:10 stop:399 length:390 start_codon:yes stop_codon:yes gene_type:complete
MTENVNITEANASTKVILDTRLPVGASPDSTSWQQKGVGEVAQGALNLLVVDLVCTTASTATTFSLDAVATATSISGVSGSEVVAVIGLNNFSGGFEVPTLIRASGATVLFTSAGGTAGDTHRLTILYR